MTKKSNSKAEDERRSQSSGDRVSRQHGGQLVESIHPEGLESFNDTECKHIRLVRDTSETDFNAFKCSNAKCGVVVLFEKT